MKKYTLLLFIGLLCHSCQKPDSVDRPYIISQSLESPEAERVSTK
jgi:hypothetical protein